MPTPCKIEEFTVHIQLPLSRGSIPNADGSDPPIALQLLYLVLIEASLAPDTEEDLDLICAAGCRPLDKSTEILQPPGRDRLLRASEP